MTKKLPAKCEFYEGRVLCDKSPSHRIYVDGEYVGSACSEHTKFLTSKFPYPKAKAAKKR